MLAMACTHEVRRERIVRRGSLTDAGASVVFTDEVHTEKSCTGDKIVLGVLTVLTLGLAYIMNEVAENKLGHRECPHTNTVYEHHKQLDTAFPTVPNAPRRIAMREPDSCVLEPDDHCVTNQFSSTDPVARTKHGWTGITRQPDASYLLTIDGESVSRKTIELRDEPWMKIGSPITVDPTGERLVVGDSNACWLVSRSATTAIRFDDCHYVRWLDPHTAWIGGRIVDAETGEAHPAEHALWLGHDLGLAEQKGDVVEIVRRHPWRVLATTTPVGIIGERDQVTIIGKHEVVMIRPNGDVDVHALPIVPRRVLDVRGDLALVVVANERLTAATIRLSTGALVARTPEPGRR
jgi:hypothetical protein